MPYSNPCTSAKIEYLGDGTTVLYPFPFEYTKQSDVKVYIWNDNQYELNTDWTFENATTIRFNTAPPASTNPVGQNAIRIVRETDIEPLNAQFYPGASIKAKDLNDNFEQLKFAVEENRCIADGNYWKRYEDTLHSNETWSGSDTTIATTAAIDAAFLRQDSTETINSGIPWSSSDAFVATTAAIDARIVDLVEEVGGFVPIDNETSFPLENPDINDGDGTLISIKEISTDRGIGGGTVTIANGAGTNTVTITGVPTTGMLAGYGAIVETTSTLHTYAFHRLAPPAVEVTTVANNIGDVNTVADNITDVNTVASNIGNINTVEDNITNVNTVATNITDVNTVATNISDINVIEDNIADIQTVASDLNEPVSEIDTVATNIANVNTVGTNIANVNTVATNISDVNTVATDITNVNTVANDITNVNTVATNIDSVNGFANKYRIGPTDPTTDNDEGDLFYNTTSDTLKIWDGSSWHVGVTVLNYLPTTGGTMTGDITFNSTQLFDGRDVSADGTKLDGIETGATADQTKADIDALGIDAATLDGIDSTSFLRSDVADAKTSGNLTFNDGVEARFGTLGNFRVYHSGGTSYVAHTGPSSLLLANTANDQDVVIQTDNGSGGIATYLLADGSTGQLNLYHYGSLKANTDSAGFSVTGNITVSGTVDGRDVAADGTKLDGIEASADVTDATNVAAAGAVMESDTTTASMSFVVDEDTMVSNLDTKVPTQQSVKAYVDSSISGLVDSAPTTLDTLNELAAALGDDPNFATTITNSIGDKLPLAGGTMTGNIVMSGTQTVDGRDLSVDGAKLDGIEVGATADQDASEVTYDPSTSGMTATDLQDAIDELDSRLDNSTNTGTSGPVFWSRSGTTVSPINSGDSVSVNGNLSITGTVDGRDVSVDGAKLDGIAAGAEVNVQSDWNATSGDAFIANKPTIPTNNNQLTNGAGYITSAPGTNLGNTPSSITVDITSSTGNNTTIDPASSSYAGVMTAAQYTKLSGIAAGAEVNVQSDWNASSGDAQILNKPTIPTNNNQLTNGAGYITSAGNAATATQPYVDLDSNTNTNRYLTFADSSTAGYQGISVDNTLKYNPFSGTVTAINFAGTLVGTAQNSDQLNSQYASYYLDYNNFTNTPTIPVAANLYRLVDSASATVGPGWMTVATNTSGRSHGVVYVSDSDSGDHAFIEIDWMRSYGDSNFTVINCGGHQNRITGARVISESADPTYGTKILQVYVTVGSTYRVQVSQAQNQSGWVSHTAVTPVIENTKTGYALTDFQLSELDTYGAAVAEGFQAGGRIKSQTGFTVDNSTNSSIVNPGQVTVNGGTNNQVMLKATDGSIEISRNGGGAYIDFKDSSSEDKDARLQLVGTNIVLNGSRLLTVADEGSGNGLDADTLDSYHSTNFIGKNGNSYYRPDTWIDFASSNGAGLYWSSGTGAGFHFNPSSTSTMVLRSGDSSGVNLQMQTAGTLRGSMYANNSNQIGFLNTSGSWSLKVDNSGNVTATGDVTAYSDIRLKSDIQPITNALDKVSQINGVTFTRVDSGERQVGVIAQDVEKVLPEAVTNGEEYKSVAYGNMVGLLIEAVKELSAQVEELKKGAE